MLEVRYGKVKSKIAAVFVMALYCMELPGLFKGIFEAVSAFAAMSMLGVGTALSAAQTLAVVLPIISRMVFMTYYLKLLAPVPRNHRLGMLVMVSANVAFSVANVIVAAVANSSGAGNLLLALLNLCISPSVMLLIGLIARRKTELWAAAARLLSLVMAVISAVAAGTWPAVTTLLIAGLYIAVLLLHPVLERPMFERRVKPVWDFETTGGEQHV